MKFKACEWLVLVSVVLVSVSCNGSSQTHVTQSEVRVVDSKSEKLPIKLRAECTKPMVSEVLALANKARADKKLSSFECDARLSRAASLHAEDMCAKNYFSHTSKDGRAFHERFQAQDVEFVVAGENIAQGQTAAASVHTGWMNSAGHRKNILNRQFTRLGVGYAPCADGPYWVQTFAG